MKNIIHLIIGIIIGFSIASVIAIAENPTYLRTETIWNRVFDSSSNTITIVGQQ